MSIDHALEPGELRPEASQGMFRSPPFLGSLAAASQRAARAEGGQLNTDVALQQQEADLSALLARIAQRDERALGEFYDATMARVYGLALRVTARPDAAEEVAADVYLQVWRDARRYEASRGRVLAWLLTICRSRAIDSIRRRDEAQTSADPEQLRTGEPGGEDDPQDLLLLAQRDGALHHALAQLEPVQRQLLSLAFFRGFTHEEIATHARLPLGSVKTHIRKALALLRAKLAEPLRRMS
jgi:RNA polymerase sigma-70 factor (ECF subfamily)